MNAPVTVTGDRVHFIIWCGVEGISQLDGAARLSAVVPTLLPPHRRTAQTALLSRQSVLVCTRSHITHSPKQEMKRQHQGLCVQCTKACRLKTRHQCRLPKSVYHL